MRNHEQSARRLCVALAAALALAALAPGAARAAPVTTLTVSEPSHGTSPTYVSAATEFTLSSVDASSQPVADIWYRWSNASVTHNWTKYTGAFTAVVEMQTPSGAPGLPIDLEGAWTLSYNATDSLGGSETTKSLQVFVDNSHPATQIGYSGASYSGTYLYIESGSDISLSATDTGSGVANIFYTLDAGNETAYSAPFSLTSPGPATIKYRSVDNLGNYEPEKSVSVYIDDAAPSVIASAGTPQCTADGVLYISSSTPLFVQATDVSGISASYYRIDEGAWTQYSSQFTVATEGTHIVHAYARDNLGHTSPETSFSFRVDSTAPTATLVGAEGDSVEVGKGTALVIECSDAGAQNCDVYYSTDAGTTWTLYTGPFIAAEDMTLNYYAEDGVGNRAAETTVTVKMKGGIVWTSQLTVIWVGGCIAIAALSFLAYRKMKAKEGKGHVVFERAERDSEEKDGDRPRKKMKRNR